MISPHAQTSAVDASEERDEALSSLDARDDQIRSLQGQAEQAVRLKQQLETKETELGELQGTAQKLRLELEAQLASRDAQACSALLHSASRGRKACWWHHQGCKITPCSMAAYAKPMQQTWLSIAFDCAKCQVLSQVQHCTIC